MTDSVGLLSWIFRGGKAPVDACKTEDGGGSLACRSLVAPPNAKAFGKSLREWLDTYWRWYFSTNADPAQNQVGRVQLLPIPVPEVVGGSFTPDDPLVLKGHLEITLPPGTPFVIPQFAWTRERYDPSLGIPDDPPIPDDIILAGVSPNLKIDGCPIVSDANELRYYIPTHLMDPIVVYPQPSSYGSIAMIAWQGDGIVAHPLSPGVHVMTLYEPYIISGVPGIADFGVIYDNTWTITVNPHE